MVEHQLPSPGCTTAGKELVSYPELRFSLGPLTPTIHLLEGAPPPSSEAPGEAQ